MLDRHTRGWVVAVVSGALVASCGGKTSGTSNAGSSGSSGATSGSTTIAGATLVRGGVDKIDLLFMIDNSPSMGDKHALLAEAVPGMIRRLVSPNCVDAAGNPTGSTFSPAGGCATGKAEFPPVHDMHIGIVTSSLGGRGGDQCDPNEKNRANMTLLAHNDDRGELIIRGGASESPVADAQAPGGGGNFLAWFPPIVQNMGSGKMPSDVAALGAGGPGDPTAMGTLIGDFTTMIQGVHEHGCGFEAQNEAWYRFLVQPDPFDHIQINGQSVAQLSGIDATILKQRADFLRPDSLVAVIVVTDENEEVADPLALKGQAWTFENSQFPGSPNYAAPEGTIECKNAVDQNSPTTTGPYDKNCTSCAFIKGDPSFATRCPNDGSGTQGFLDPMNDQLNVRFFNQKQRFGVFVGYPTSRYVRGLSKSSVPDSGHEHDKDGNYAGDSQSNCVNPLFATQLPTDPNGELCALHRGPRTPDLVYYAAIAGVPHELLQQDRSNPDSPQKEVLGEADWQLITGKDPEHYDFTGADFHMIESYLPRTAENLPPGVVNASQCPPGSSDTCDPINGRERDTKKGDLEFACIFALPMSKDCTNPMFAAACACSAGNPTQNSPLCDSSSGSHTTTQISAKVYPSVREMVIAHAMGAQGIVSSLCPIHVTPANGDSPPDPLYGYRPALNTIVNRLKVSLAVQCLPQKLTPNSTGAAPCEVLLVLPGGGSCMNPTCDAARGLSVPPQDLLTGFCAAAEAEWQQGAGVIVSAPDPAHQNVCQLKQLTSTGAPTAFDAFGSCAAPPDPSKVGWCYVEGAAAGACPQAIEFTNGAPPAGATAYVKCM
jgi:hypothetical protein